MKEFYPNTFAPYKPKGTRKLIFNLLNNLPKILHTIFPLFPKYIFSSSSLVHVFVQLFDFCSTVCNITLFSKHNIYISH